LRHLPAIAFFILFCLRLSGSIILSEISFEHPAGLDDKELLRVSGLITGMETEVAELANARSLLLDYLTANYNPYIRIENPEIIPLEANRVSVHFKITEMVRADEVRVRFSGLRYFSDEKLRQAILSPPEKHYALQELPALMDRITEAYARRGYLFCEVGLGSVSIDTLASPPGLEAEIRITEGKPLRPERIICRGNKHTRAEALIKTSGLMQLRVVTPEDILSAEQKILAKAYIRSAGIIPVDDKSLLISVEEGKMTYLEGVAGFSRVNGKTKINGLVNLKFLNLWGTDRAVSLYWKQVPGGSGSLLLGYHESGLARYPFAADLSLNRTTQDSTWIKSKVIADLYYYRLANRFGLELISEGISPGYGRPTSIVSSSSQSIGGFWDYRRTDHPKNPSRGLEYDLRYRLILGESVARNAFEMNGAGYVPLGGAWTAGLGLHIRSLNKDPGQDYGLYKIGGYGSVRGYREETITGWRLGWASAEMRYRLSPDSRVYIFYDQAAKANSSTSLNWQYFGLGAGIKLQTKVGILSIEYGLGYNGNSLNNINMGIVHAGIDTSF